MPVHDWSRVEAGTYHDFHQDWTIELRRTLNQGILPAGSIAMADQPVSGREGTAGLATEAGLYARKANRIAIRQGLGRVVAMIEVVSPGNKDSRAAVASFVGKAVDFLRNGIHFLMVDPFGPGPRDPAGLARAIWDELVGEPFETPPADRPLAVAAFDAGPPLTAYVENLAVGDSLPVAPLFLAPGWYVNVPLETISMASWAQTPAPIRDLVAPAAGG